VQEWLVAKGYAWECIEQPTATYHKAYRGVTKKAGVKRDPLSSRLFDKAWPIIRPGYSKAELGSSERMPAVKHETRPHPFFILSLAGTLVLGLRQEKERLQTSLLVSEK